VQPEALFSDSKKDWFAIRVIDRRSTLPKACLIPRDHESQFFPASNGSVRRAPDSGSMGSAFKGALRHEGANDTGRWAGVCNEDVGWTVCWRERTLHCVDATTVSDRFQGRQPMLRKARLLCP
jgi:hypothetical protein